MGPPPLSFYFSGNIRYLHNCSSKICPNTGRSPDKTSFIHDAAIRMLRLHSHSHDDDLSSACIRFSPALSQSLLLPQEPLSLLLKLLSLLLPLKLLSLPLPRELLSLLQPP